MVYVITQGFSSAVKGRILTRARYVIGRILAHVWIVGETDK